MTQPTVFISYSHDSPEHADRVLALADRLIYDGINCILDQYETSPPEGWPKWMDRHIAKSDFVIVICTETYYRRVMGEEEPGKGRGVKWESTLTYQHLYDADAEDIQFIPVLFRSGQAEHIPTPLRGATYYYVDTEKGYEDLYRRLTNQPRTVKPELGKLRKLPPRERKERGRSRVLDAIPIIQEKEAEDSAKLPQILLDFASAPSLQDWEVEDDSDCLTLEYDAMLGKRVLVKKGPGFDPAVTYKRQGAPPLDWSYPHYELAVRLHPESFIYIYVSDKTGKERTLLYSSAIPPGLNEHEEFMIPLDKEVSGNWHSLIIDIPKHMGQAHWPGFEKVNWLRLRGEVMLAGIRGCDDKDPLIESAIASKYDVHFPILAANDTLRPDSVPSSKDPATFVPYVISNNRIDLVDSHVLLNAAESPQHGRELILWLSVEDPAKASAMIEEIGPDLLVSLSDSPQDVHNLLLDLEAQSPSIGKLLANKTTLRFAMQMSKSPGDWKEAQSILQRLQIETKGEGEMVLSLESEVVYDFFDCFVEADSSDHRKKSHCVILPDRKLVSAGVAKRGIFQHPPLPGDRSSLPYPPITISEHIRELWLDLFIGILDKRPHKPDEPQKKFDVPRKEDAVKFSVRINGKVELDEKLNSVGWVPYSLPIELPTDRKLIVEFITDAMSNATYNWAAWGEPRLVGTRAVQKEVVATVSSISQVAERPTASELRRFLDEDFPRLENALHDVWVSLSGHSPLVKYSATSNWNSIASRFTDVPAKIRDVFDEVVATRELAWGGPSKLTEEQLSSARQEINQVLEFLRQRFPTAGVDLPPPGTQTTTPQAVSERAPSERQIDFAIITALEKEAKAVVSRLENYSLKRFEDRDIRTYHCGTVPIQGTDHSYHVAVVLLPSMGEISAATATTDAITLWNPRFVLIVGIAGGIPQDDLDLGDVVVADQVVGYDYGKVTDQGIKPRDHVYPASALLLDRVRNFWDDSWTGQINVPRPESARRAVSKSKLFIGPIASGNKVVASTAFRQQLTTHWPKLIAVEMEAEGVFAAVFDRPQIRGTLVIRGICDMADERKSDDWQEYAADAAAAFVISFLRSRPLDPLQVRPQEVPPPPAPKKTVPPAPEKISLAKLPSTSPDLFGREKELAMLDAAWENPQTHVVSLAAWGGVGKTALVNKHLLQMGKDNYRGAERVFGWSFYSRGAREGGQASADQFIAAALEWFGDPDPTKGSPWDKGERLAELVKKQRTLLILDGLEPLQYPPGEMGGRLKDPGLCCLLRELARHNPGLCLITTRLPVDDLKEFVGTSVESIHLEHLSPEAGAAYLAHLGVKGTPKEPKQAVREFEGHALALTLLGSYLAVVYQGDIRQRDKIARLTRERKQGGHARRVMESYEGWFQGKPELNILRMMGLFDRPAEGDAIEALRTRPAIPGLTSELQELSHEDWQFAVNNLRAARLLAGEDPRQPDTLDCHPLVREHFGEKLEEGNLDAWREAHSRLYEYYKSQAPEYPDTIEEMAPLYAAVAHGCQAGRHQEALDEVYRRRIQRGDEFFNTRKLGAFGAALAALFGFFDLPWRQPVAGLTEDVKGFVLNDAGLCLRALGRLAEAARPMQAALEAFIAQENWKEAAINAGNLSELTLTSGDLARALDYARQSVDLADRSGDTFQRIGKRTTLADALHQAGRIEEAAAAFREAEEMQKERQPQYPLLYSLRGFQYCELLLGQGEYQEVQNRASQTLKWATQGGLSLLTIALEHLSLGRAYLFQAQQEGSRDFAQAAAHLNRAVDGLRQAGQQDELPRGLLARAALRRAMGTLDRAQADLEEALSIAARGGMQLHEGDCHLEYARLHLACGEKEKAQESLATARAMIAEMGYHRRDGEVAELEGELEPLKH